MKAMQIQMPTQPGGAQQPEKPAAETPGEKVFQSKESSHCLASASCLSHIVISLDVVSKNNIFFLIWIFAG